MKIGWIVLCTLMFSFLFADAYHFETADDAAVLVKSGKKDEDQDDDEEVVLAKSGKKDDDKDDDDDESELRIV